MVCRVADNPALEKLRRDLGLKRSCHSRRSDCVRLLPKPTEPGYYGISGAFMGYCQALFQQIGSYEQNTSRIMKLLGNANLPWSRSHELYLGHRRTHSIQYFVEEAARPLTKLGRVPILITGIDVNEYDLVTEILNSKISVVSGETVLVRLTVESVASGKSAVQLVSRLFGEAQSNQRMPRWWPLLQASEGTSIWHDIREELGELWQYVNVAINPFTDERVSEIVRDQTTVCQIVVTGLADVTEEGEVRISEGMSIYGAEIGDRYHIGEMVLRLAEFDSWPTCIFLGPTLPHWSDEENLERTRRSVVAFANEARSLWDKSRLDRYAALWDMTA